MKTNKKILLSLIFISIVCLVVGYVVRFPVESGLCPPRANWQDISCERKFPIFEVGKPLSMVPVYILPVFILLFFLPETFYLAWRRFALVFGIIGIVVIAIAPPLCDGYICIFEKDGVTLTVGSLFFIISLLIIIYQAFKKKA